MTLKSWVVRAGHEGEREDRALKDNASYAGWPDFFHDLSSLDRDGISGILRQEFPESSNYTLGSWTGQLYRFVHEINKGDLILMPLKNSSGIAIGHVASDYCYNEGAGNGFQHYRDVRWRASPLDVSELRRDLRSSLGGLATIYEIRRNGAASRFNAAFSTNTDPGPSEIPTNHISQFASLARDKNTVTTIGNLLDLVDAPRRSNSAVNLIEEELSALGLELKDNISEGDVGDLITIGPSRTQTLTKNRRAAYFSVANFVPPDQELIHVAENDPIEYARTLMIKNNYSQLPVVEEGAVVGVITWDSMAAASLGGAVNCVGDATDYQVSQVGHGTSVDLVWGEIFRRGFVLVVDEGDNYKILTVFDLAEKFAKERLPLMRIEELEIRLRNVIARSGLTDNDLSAAASRSSNQGLLDDIKLKIDKEYHRNLGSYPLIFADSVFWESIEHNGLSQKVIVEALQHATDLRNYLMHFSQDDPGLNLLDSLEGALRLIRALTSHSEFSRALEGDRKE